MIEFLYIRDFALVETLQIEFGPGLNLMTGETGAGKSVLIDALSQLLGARGSKQLIRTGCRQARIEGAFLVADVGPVATLLKDAAIECEDGRLLVRRDISLSAGSRIFLNGTLVTQHFLSRLGGRLVDIHGQHEQQTLLESRSHLGWIDSHGGLKSKADSVAEAFRAWSKASRELTHIRDQEGERLRDVDHLRFQLADIEKLKLTPDLEEVLRRDQALLASAELRSHNSHAAYDLLYERDDALLSRLAQVERHVGELSAVDSALNDAAADIAECRIRLQDVAFQLREYQDSVEFDPAGLERVESHLAQLQSAKRRYGQSVREILDFRESLQARLQELLEQEDRVDDLEEELERWGVIYQKRASKLSIQRKKAAETLCKRVSGELAELAMPAARFVPHFADSNETPSEQGLDRMEFTFSANPGEPPRPLSQVASGGELSRLSLALKSIVHLDEDAKTLVFDEVDAGIGGRTASALSHKLQAVSRSHQVLCVTHLPQIAAVASRHFYVSKLEEGGRTQVRVDQLSEEERVPELARMLAGSQATATTLAQAKELLDGSSAAVTP